MLLAGLVVLGITLCMAEVGSSFSATGGPYLYAHETFGPVVGFEVGWLMWVTQLGGFASVTNLFVNYLGWFFPGVTAGLPRIAIIVTVLAFLTAVNILGVRRAATLNNVLTAGKMIPLALCVEVGLFRVDGALLVPTTVPTAAALSEGGAPLSLSGWSNRYRLYGHCLISPTVFLTAAHCIAWLPGIGIPADDVYVTFDSAYEIGTSTIYPGTYYLNPNFGHDNGDLNDVAVIVLDEPVTHIAPASLPSAGLLDELKASGALKNQPFVTVGYGTVRDDKTGGFHPLTGKAHGGL